ncbi:RcnB family protein [Novosphingobium sp.]|uniref:RcnB family protein n=1 Tax=Novosphingobium sp. TaxID=1874826 RepID=UPI0027346896|nr:RcnB family protein [Novosphingobium sp.]MDP3906532.1 RcnB family protein [Novosphingobium sp.]
MKRLMIGAALIALLASPVASAKSDNSRSPRAETQQRQDNRQWHPQGSRADKGHWDNGRHLGWGRDRGNKARWGRGQQLGYNDWRNARRIDYRRYNLRQPPRGYEWRQINDRYVMASTVNGMIVSVILRGGR